MNINQKQGGEKMPKKLLVVEHKYKWTDEDGKTVHGKDIAVGSWSRKDGKKRLVCAWFDAKYNLLGSYDITPEEFKSECKVLAEI